MWNVWCLNFKSAASKLQAVICIFAACRLHSAVAADLQSAVCMLQICKLQHAICSRRIWKFFQSQFLNLINYSYLFIYFNFYACVIQDCALRIDSRTSWRLTTPWAFHNYGCMMELYLTLIINWCYIVLDIVYQILMLIFHL